MGSMEMVVRIDEDSIKKLTELKEQLDAIAARIEKAVGIAPERLVGDGNTSGVHIGIDEGLGDTTAYFCDYQDSDCRSPAACAKLGKCIQDPRKKTT